MTELIAMHFLKIIGHCFSTYIWEYVNILQPVLLSSYFLHGYSWSSRLGLSLNSPGPLADCWFSTAILQRTIQRCFDMVRIPFYILLLYVAAVYTAVYTYIQCILNKMWNWKEIYIFLKLTMLSVFAYY